MGCLLPGVILLLAQHLAAAPADNQYSVAAAHYTHGRWQLAADEFESFLRQFPRDSRATAVIFFLGETLVQLQRYPEASDRFGEYLRQAPQDRYATQARFRLAELTFFQGDYRQARESLETFRTQHNESPLNAYVLAYLGEIALTAGDGPGAEALYREAIERYREGPLERQCRFGLAHALELQGNVEEAIRFYRFLVENGQGTLADDAQLQIGALLYKKGDYDAAIAALADFETAFPQSPLRVTARYWVGMSYLASARYRDAVTALAAAAGSTPSPELAPAIEFAWADALQKLGDGEAARAHLQNVLNNWPECAWADDAHQVLAQTAFQANDLEAAVRLGREFAQKHPDSPLRSVAAQTLGRALLKQEQFEAAIEVFEALLASDSASSDANQTDSVESQLAMGEPLATTASRRANQYYLALALLGVGRADAALSMLDGIRPGANERELAAGLLVARASCLIALKRFAEAIEPLQNYLQEHPEGPEAAACSARLVVALAESGDDEAAAQSFQRFRERFAGHALLLPTAEYLADRAAARQQEEVARGLYQMLADSRESPDYVAKGLAGLGKMQLKAGSAADSAKTFTTLLDQAPLSPQAAEAAFLRAKSLEGSDRSAEAAEAYRAVVDRFPATSQAPRALLACAQLQERLGKHTEALLLLEQLTQQYGTSPEMPTALYQMAWLQADQQRTADAETTFRRIAEGFPGTRYWGDAVYRLAERALQASDRASAKQWLVRLVAAEVEPDIRAHGLYLQGKVAIDDRDWEAALAPLEKLTQEFSGHKLQEPADYWRAEALFRLERYDEAARVLDALEQAGLDSGDTWTAMVPLRRAQILAQQDRWDEAFELARAIEERFPDFRQQYEADYLIGRCLSHQARFREARESYERAINAASGARTETAAMAQWMIGESYFHQKDYEQAMRAYHRVESLYAFPRWQAAALLQAAKCHELLGRRAEAERLYAQLIKDYPDSEYAAEATRRVKGESTSDSGEALLGVRN